jgi:hypothetical protein
MSFPTIVYIKDGPHDCKGGTYGYLSVADEKELRQALSQGYKKTLEEALSVSKTQAKKAAKPLDTTEPLPDLTSEKDSNELDETTSSSEGV